MISFPKAGGMYLSGFKIAVMNLLLTIIVKSYLFVLLTFFQFPNYTKHWNGGDQPGHTFASFEDFNGKQDFRVQRNGKGNFSLVYSAELKKGTLSIEIKKGSETILQRDVNGSIADSIKLDNSKGEKYHVTFRAKHAEGKFDVKYN